MTLIRNVYNSDDIFNAYYLVLTLFDDLYGNAYSWQNGLLDLLFLRNVFGQVMQNKYTREHGRKHLAFTQGNVGLEGGFCRLEKRLVHLRRNTNNATEPTSE